MSNESVKLRGCSPKGSHPSANCPPHLSQEIDFIPWDEMGHKTRHTEIEYIVGTEFRGWKRRGKIEKAKKNRQPLLLGLQEWK
jgi:hypothetical protein